jgi:hypothetical protein
MSATCLRRSFVTKGKTIVPSGMDQLNGRITAAAV